MSWAPALRVAARRIQIYVVHIWPSQNSGLNIYTCRYKEQWFKEEQLFAIEISSAYSTNIISQFI